MVFVRHRDSPSFGLRRSICGTDFALAQLAKRRNGKIRDPIGSMPTNRNLIDFANYPLAALVVAASGTLKTVYPCMIPFIIPL